MMPHELNWGGGLDPPRARSIGGRMAAIEGSKAPAGHRSLDIRAKLPLKPNPVLAQHARERAEHAQNRIADRITTFAGSMLFVYIHIVWFGCWIGFGVEHYPYGLLTMIVSLEAIFLSTFVMISQNRADAKRQIVADQQWATVKEEDRQNDELLDLSRQILDLTKQVHQLATSLSEQDGSSPAPTG
jgi:uncharacterized membrane protein